MSAPPAEPDAAPEVVTLGETMGVFAADDVGPLRTGHRMVLGMAGAESNVAVGLARLGHVATWIGRVGADPVGAMILRELRAERVDTAHAVVDPAAPTGLMLKVRRTTATSEVIYVRRGSAGSNLRPEDVDPALIRRAKLLHITGITPALSRSAHDAVVHAIDVAGAHGVRVSFDLNYRAALWPDDATATGALRHLTTRCDVLFASENEAALVVGDRNPEDAAKALAALGPRHVVVKRGEHGYVASIDGEILCGDAVSVPVADPVGAGDAFVAGYLASWLEGRTPTDALRTANLAGAFVVAVPGDWEGFPTYAELSAFANRADAVSR